MESKLHQNAILTGCVDSYCLICESLLRAEDVFNHIGKTIHKKNLNASAYVQKYKDEFIRKVGIYAAVKYEQIFYSKSTRYN